MSGCCDDPPPLYRYAPDGTLERSTDGGETWTAANGYDPRFNSPQFPPVSGADGDDKKCLTATGAALLMKEQVADNLTDDMARYTLAQLISDWVNTVTQDGGNILDALETIIANQAFALGIAALRAALTDTVWDTMKCIIYCHIKPDASFDEAGWQAVKSDIASKIGGIASLFLQQLVNVLGPVGMTNMARSGGATTGDCSACDCSDCTNLDAWAIQSFDGHNVGIEVTRGDNFITLTGTSHPDFGTPYNAIIKTPDTMSCCKVMSIETLDGDGTDYHFFHVECGLGQWPSGTFTNFAGIPEPTYSNQIFIRKDSGSNFTVKITFSG